MLPKLPKYYPKKTTREDKFYLAFFLVAVFGGALRKWVFSSSAVGNLVLLAQLALPFLMILFRSAKATSPFLNFRILTLYFVYLVVQIFNPYQLTIYHGITGIAIYGGFWLSLFFYFSNRHLFNPARYMPFMLFVVLGQFVLGFVQYQLPQTDFINRYANMEVIKDIATVDNKVRITGTFSYIGGFGSFFLFYLFFIWASIRLKYQAWIVVSISLFGVVVAFMSGSRSVGFLYFLFVTAILLKEYNLSTITALIGKTLLPVTIMATALLLFSKIPLLDVITSASDGFWGRVNNGRQSGEENFRIFWDLNYFNEFRFINPWFGIGTGASYQGALQLFGTSPYTIEYGYVEGELVKIMLEGGVIMVCFKLILSFVMTQQLMFKGVAKWVVWFVVAYVCPVVFHVHNAAFIFFGIVLLDNIFWRQHLEDLRFKVEKGREKESGKLEEQNDASIYKEFDESIATPGMLP